jgi:hypothetical protein
MKKDLNQEKGENGLENLCVSNILFKGSYPPKAGGGSTPRATKESGFGCFCVYITHEP